MSKIKPKAMIGDIPVYCAHDEIVDIVKVIPNPRNPNMHPHRQIEILAQVIKAQGWRKPITVSKRSGFVVSGHGRLQAAILLQEMQVPVDYQDYATEADEWADLIADNRISELSNVDENLLIDILNDLNDTDIDIMLTGYEYHEIDDLINDDEALQVIESLTSDANHEKPHSEPKSTIPGTTTEEPTEPTTEQSTEEPTEPSTEEPQITTTTNFNYKEQYGVIVICKDEGEQKEVYERLHSEGYECKVVTT